MKESLRTTKFGHYQACQCVSGIIFSIDKTRKKK